MKKILALVFMMLITVTPCMAMTVPVVQEYDNLVVEYDDREIHFWLPDGSSAEITILAELSYEINPEKFPGARDYILAHTEKIWVEGRRTMKASELRKMHKLQGLRLEKLSVSEIKPGWRVITHNVGKNAIVPITVVVVWKIRKKRKLRM